jgi:anti-anti-sigma factor
VSLVKHTVQIDVRIDGDEAVLALSGRFTIRDSGILTGKVDALLRAGCRTLLVDLESVSYVDSAGLGELISVYVRAKQEGAVLRIKISKPVRNLIESLKRVEEASGRLREIFEAGPHEHILDPLNPRLRDIRWELTVGVAVTILVIVGVMLLLR